MTELGDFAKEIVELLEVRSSPKLTFNESWGSSFEYLSCQITGYVPDRVMTRFFEIGLKLSYDSGSLTVTKEIPIKK